jgi:type VI secretion system secreted protein Hcp
MTENSTRKIRLGVLFAAAILAAGISTYAIGINAPGVFTKTASPEMQVDMTNLGLPTADAASVDYFLKIDGVDGESTDDRHKGEIEIQSFSWGASNPTSYGSGGAGSGKVHFSDFSIMKTVDKASPQLFTKAATGEHIKEVVLTGQMQGGNPSVFYTVKMEDVVVSSFWQTNGNGGAAMESLHFSFSKIQVEYIPMNADGTQGEAIKAGYDVKTATKI